MRFLLRQIANWLNRDYNQMRAERDAAWLKYDALLAEWDGFLARQPWASTIENVKYLETQVEELLREQRELLAANDELTRDFQQKIALANEEALAEIRTRYNALVLQLSLIVQEHK